MSSCTYLSIKYCLTGKEKEEQDVVLAEMEMIKGEIDIRSNTNYTMLLKPWKNCGFANTERKAGILHNILDLFRGSWPLCDCLLMPNGGEENPDFILQPLQ